MRPHGWKKYFRSLFRIRSSPEVSEITRHTQALESILELTGAEFDLLSSFLANPQRVIARERLIELSRTRLGDSSDRSVDVLVSRLRRKLSVAGQNAPITTVRGIGYMFNAQVEYV